MAAAEEMWQEGRWNNDGRRTPDNGDTHINQTEITGGGDLAVATTMRTLTTVLAVGEAMTTRFTDDAVGRMVNTG